MFGLVGVLGKFKVLDGLGKENCAAGNFFRGLLPIWCHIDFCGVVSEAGKVNKHVQGGERVNCSDPLAKITVLKVDPSLQRSLVGLAELRRHDFVSLGPARAGCKDDSVALGVLDTDLQIFVFFFKVVGPYGDP